MSKQEAAQKVPRFAIRARARDRLLATYAPAEPRRTQLKNLISGIQSSLHADMPRRARATGAERQSALDHLKDLEKTLRKSAQLLNAHVEPKRRVAANLLAAEIARSLTDESFRLAGLPIHEPSSRERAIARVGPREPALDNAQEERRQRESIARRSNVALACLLGRCQTLIAARLAVERKNRGGHPGNALRKYVLVQLALAVEEIFGVPPTAGETGFFVRLATEVLGLFGLETVGVGAAAKRVLAQIMAPAASRSKPIK